jgi:glycine/D-amino acid oxidase-like deaminating enzyme
VNEYPYWLDTLHDAQRGLLRKSNAERGTSDDGPLPPRADVVIVGAGYTGLAAARQLARAGAATVVIEREQVGWGASSRNGGQVLTGMKVEPAALVARFGVDRARELFDIATASIARLETLIAEEAIDCEYVRSGHLQAAFKPAHFRGFLDEQELLSRVFKHEVRVVSRADQHAEIGSDAYYGVLVDQRSGGLKPAR